jgi:hypothetical protein
MIPTRLCGPRPFAVETMRTQFVPCSQVVLSAPNIATTVIDARRFRRPRDQSSRLHLTSLPGENAPSELNFEYSFDGAAYTLLPPVLLTSPPGDAGVFYNVSRTFVSGTNQTVWLRISNGLTAAGGNDFALDDITLSVAPEPARPGP